MASCLPIIGVPLLGGNRFSAYVFFTKTTPGGVVPHVDVMSLRPSMAGGEQIALEEEAVLLSAEELRRPIELADALAPGKSRWPRRWPVVRLRMVL